MSGRFLVKRPSVGDFHDVTAAALTPRGCFTFCAPILRRFLTNGYICGASSRCGRGGPSQKVAEVCLLRNDEFRVFSEAASLARLLRKIFPPLVLFVLLRWPLAYCLLPVVNRAKWSGVVAIFLIALILLIVWHYYQLADEFMC
jgi:hypothetical protein